MSHTTKSIDYFLEHFNKEELNQGEINQTENFLINLYELTQAAWRPRECRQLFIYTNQAEEIKKRYSLLGTIKEKRWAQAHFFWTTQVSSGTFIIDPTGVPKNRTVIIPYFGLDRLAPQTHKTIYLNNEDINDNWGTREFPKGFHP